MKEQTKEWVHEKLLEGVRTRHSSKTLKMYRKRVLHEVDERIKKLDNHDDHLGMLVLRAQTDRDELFCPSEVESTPKETKELIHSPLKGFAS